MKTKQRILIVEDERNIASFISTILIANQYEVLIGMSASDALMKITSQCPDLILLDLGLPDADGMNIIKSVREWSHTPIIVVSARERERDKVAALDMGADDYVTKPFGTSELLARVRAALRHAENSQGSAAGLTATGIFECGALVIDFDKRRITVGGQEAHLTQIEFKLVALLARYPGRVLTYDYLITHIWGPHVKGDNQILRVNMANIRRKLEENPAQPKYLLTEMGVGYRMADMDPGMEEPS